MVTAVVSIVTFLAGLLLGHKLAVGRDKRREFNEIARPVRAWLVEEQQHPSAYREAPDLATLDAFKTRLSDRKLREFDSLLETYWAIKRDQQRQDQAGGIYYAEDEPIRAAVDDLIPFTAPR